MRALALPRDDWRLIVGGAVLLCAAYPPFHLFLPSFLCLVPAVWLIMAGAEDPRPVRRHLVQGFWFGLLGNGLVLYWITVALWRFSRLSALGYLVTIVVLGVSCAAAFAVTGWVVRRTRVGPVVVFPIVWTTVEWAIGHLPQVGFPWLGLGTSLTGYPTVVQLADIVGARGITYLLALANAALAMAWLRRSDRKRGALLAGGVVVGLVLAWGYGVARERGLAVRPVGRIAVLQPNVGWSEKWEPALQDSIVEGLLNLSARALYESRPGLVVWPEAAVPGYFHRHPQWRRRIAELSRATATPQLVGGFHYVPGEGGSYEYYNAAFLFDSLGRDARTSTTTRRSSSIHWAVTMANQCTTSSTWCPSPSASRFSTRAGSRCGSSRATASVSLRRHERGVSARGAPGHAGHREPSWNCPGGEQRDLRVRGSPRPPAPADGPRHEDLRCTRARYH